MSNEKTPTEVGSNDQLGRRIRRLLMRALIAWWMIPSLWLFAWPLALLMFGADEATQCIKEASAVIWNGTA